MRRFLALSCAAVLLIAMAGCDAIGDSRDGSETLTSSVDVQLTSTSTTGASATQAAAALSEDASSEIADIAEASVTISGVELVGEEDAYTLSDEEQTFDLLALADGVPVDLALDEVPAGEYEQLRVAVTDTRLVLSDDTSPNLKVPSNKIKLLLPNFEIEDGSDDTEITIAFDVEDSFVRAGRSGKYIFKPTVRAESVEVGGEELSGNVEVAGEITALDSGTSVEVAGLPFALTGRTEIGDDEEENSLAAGQFVELEASVDGDTYVAQEVKQEEADAEDPATIEAPLDEVRSDDGAIVLLGASFQVDADTAFEGFNALSDLESGSRVEAAFTYDGSTDTYRLLEIESESSEDDGEDEDEEDDE
jgi:hypothetical protein